MVSRHLSAPVLLFQQIIPYMGIRHCGVHIIPGSPGHVITFVVAHFTYAALVTVANHFCCLKVHKSVLFLLLFIVLSLLPTPIVF